MSTAYLGLGSNLGNREAFLTQATDCLAECHQIKILKSSSIYETDPVGFKDQSDFLNKVIKIETTLNPQQLLETCLQIEKKLGRVRSTRLRNRPRSIDIDILMYENMSLKSPKLILPHPHMHERAFVMIPLLEISPELENAFPNKAWLNNPEEARKYIYSKSIVK